MQEIPAYDEVDVFVNRWLGGGTKMPVPTMELEAGMVEYYKTPAGMVLDLVERVAFGPDDVFIDLGSGLGQVVLLVHLLTAVRAVGVEIEPAYIDYARRCAKRLGTSEARFISADAREADLSAGTVFFLFTPFKGKVFNAVMERVRLAAEGRKIRIISYGPSSEALARLSWLSREGCDTGDLYSLQIFNTL